MNRDIANWPINDDVDQEFRFWLRAFLVSLGLGLSFAVATGVLIAFLPGGADHPTGQFARDLWPMLVEFSFWLGMFVGLLRGAGTRLGAALAGTLPWQSPANEREERAAFFGRWAASAGLAGFFLWLGRQMALAAGMADVAGFMDGFFPLATACGLAAVLFAVAALACRRRQGGAASGQ